MQRIFAIIAVSLIVGLSIIAAFLIGGGEANPPEQANQPAAPPEANRSASEAPNAFSTGQTSTSTGPAAGEANASEAARQSGRIIPGELILRFDDDASLQAAVRRLTEAGIHIKGSIRSLAMLRVGIPPGADATLLTDVLGPINARQTANRQVAVPQPIEMPDGPNAIVPFGDNWLAAIGVTEDNSDWGAGVRIAVIDSGTTSHPALKGARIYPMPMVEGSVANGHGNAVTSLIVGNGEPGQPRGLSPAAEVFAYQSLGPEGGDAFTLAQSIVDAVDRGASIINLSLGGFGDSAAVEAAVRYADSAGAVVVAAVGNDRLDAITFPAAYPEVIAVTSIDANFNWAEYPNAGLDGKWPDIAAPGVGVPAAYEEDANISFSGTSAAAPIVSAAIAAHMSETGLSAKESAQVILENASDRGEPGADPFHGDGYLDLNRALNAEQGGNVDLAVSDHYVDLNQATNLGLPVRIGVQNRGNEPVAHPTLTVFIGNTANKTTVALPPLLPGQVTEFEAFIPAEWFFENRAVALGSLVSVEGAEETNLNNNSQATQYSFPGDTTGTQ